MVSSEINIQSVINRLEWICEEMPGILTRIGADEFSFKAAADKWSKKQILGHLIDSAANNHHRLVRGQFEDGVVIGYDQIKWNAANYYQDSNGKRLILFWENYNRHILDLAKKMPDELWKREILTGEKGPVMSLVAVFADYVVHMEHHLLQITEY